MNPLSYSIINQAQLEKKDGIFISSTFADIYHHPKALAEVDYVFHQGNKLLQRWSQKQDNTYFTVAETGFGLGLNFLVTCLAWQNAKYKPKRLVFISTERWLISPELFTEFYSDKPVFNSFIKPIQVALSNRRAGFHCIEITNDISLYLLLGDATQCLKQLTATVDAWFLDGFAPAKNPKMWDLSLFSEVARLSKIGTTVATYTAASLVRKNLEVSGFTVSKTLGFDGKRNRLIAHMDKSPQTFNKDKTPWCITPIAKTHCKNQQQNQTKSLTVLGGGIAGLAVVNAAKKMAWQTTLIDNQSNYLNSTSDHTASGNPYALVMPYITARSSMEALFYWRAFEYAKRFYQPLDYNPIGITELNNANRIPDETLAALPDTLIRSDNNCLHYPSAGYVNNQILSEKLKTAIDHFHCATIDSIKYDSQQRYWQLFNSQGECIHRCSVLVIAAGIYSLKLLPELTGHVQARWGQTSLLTGADIVKDHNSATLAEGYCIPVHHKHVTDEVLLGADYQHLAASDWFNTAKKRPQSNLNNRNKWRHYDGFDFVQSASLKADYVGIRATANDHLPLCGPMIDNNQFKKDYHDLYHGRHWQVYPEATAQPNLYVLTGLGSRGFTSAPLLATYLMAMISGRPLPLERDLGKIIHPNRFLFRQMNKPPL